MTDTIHSHLERFRNVPHELGGRFIIESLCEYGWLIKPKRTAVTLPAGKQIALTLMGLTHGNECAGAAVLNEVLAHLAARHLALEVPVAFILGNPDAALANRRFLERDLNRSFNRASQATKEEARAHELGNVLKHTGFVLDLHQTARPSDRPFFIFPHSEQSYAFARAVAPRLTIVTHWGRPFSAEGMCSDEFVISHGGTGVSLELGQNGFDAYQIAVGVEAALWAIRVATAELDGESIAHRATSFTPEVYTWAEIMRWPESGFVDLKAGLTNFQHVDAGDSLGSIGAESLRVGASGKILFPKYLTREEQERLQSRPTEVCRVMKRIQPSDLPGHSLR